MKSNDRISLSAPAAALLSHLVTAAPPRLVVQATEAGWILVTTKKTFDEDAPERADWKLAVEELLEAGLIEKVGPVSYEVTGKGKEAMQQVESPAAP